MMNFTEATVAVQITVSHINSEHNLKERFRVCFGLAFPRSTIGWKNRATLSNTEKQNKTNRGKLTPAFSPLATGTCISFGS